MSFAGTYLEKASLDPEIGRINPSPNLSQIVCIPACDEPGLLKTLDGLARCSRPKGDIEIIILLNSGESATPEVVEQNLLASDEIRSFASANNSESFRILHSNITGISRKNTGAGFARKLAMDHALDRFHKCNKPEGIIISLDADTVCEKDYFISIENHFKSNPGSIACSVYFEHPLEGSEYPEIIYRAITEYELHMRYYIQAVRNAGHPYAYHTLGSAFCIRADIYARQGGMNRRSAGEDFYFLQKIIPLGNFTELNVTRVVPSPRPSGRVAFGTGPVINKFLSGEINYLESYDPRAFNDLREFISSFPLLYGINDPELENLFNAWPDSIRANLEDEFFERIREINANSAGRLTFTKRVFRWFNMFRTLKYINFAHREYYSKIPVSEAAGKFLTGAGILSGDHEGNGFDARDLLIRLRKIQREAAWPD